MKRGADRTLPLLDHLKLILEHSHNAYTFQYRCKGLQIVVEKMQDDSIEAYYADDRDGRVTVDVTQEPFDKLLRFS